MRVRLENCNGVATKVFHETETGDVRFAVTYEHDICKGHGSVLGANVLIEFVMLKNFMNAFVDTEKILSFSSVVECQRRPSSYVVVVI
jgi:hypothetical protein